MPRLEEIQEMLKMMSEEDKDNLIQLLLNEKKKVKNDGDLLKYGSWEKKTKSTNYTKN